MCGAQDWARREPPADLKEGETFHEIAVGLRGTQLMAVPVVGFACKNCGFIRQHVIEAYKP